MDASHMGRVQIHDATQLLQGRDQLQSPAVVGVVPRPRGHAHVQPLWRTPRPTTCTRQAHQPHVRGLKKLSVTAFSYPRTPRCTQHTTLPLRSVLQLPTVEFRSLKDDDSPSGVATVRTSAAQRLIHCAICLMCTMDMACASSHRGTLTVDGLCGVQGAH